MGDSRIIRFRAWNKDTNRMIALKAITPLATNIGEGGDGLYLPFEDYIILEQFTGLLDKNGKDIYEGDILESKSDSYLVVEYIVEDAAFFATRYPQKFSVLLRTRSSESKRGEVIGNIHENAELLKKEQQ